MSNLCDLSWGRPGAGNIKAHGYSGVIRYLSRDTSGKTLSPVERDEYFGAGLTIHLVFEDGAQNALAGHAQGLADGQVALEQAKALGLPKGYGIYFAVDFDANAAQINGPVKEYQAGFDEALGGYYDSAPYGGINTVNAFNGKKWQTCAWSAGKVGSGVNIYQNGQSDFGGSVDVDEYLADDGWDWTKAENPLASVPAPVAPVSNPNPNLSGGPGGSYTVKSGDTLSGIGAQLGVDWRAIAQLNNIGSPFTIYPNEVLHIPGGHPSAPASVTTRYTVQKGDTLSAVGAKFGLSYETIAQVNGIADPNKIYPGQVLVISRGNPSQQASRAVYTVVRGDTLSGIGSKTGTDWRTVAELNGIAAPYVIYPGQELRLN